MNLQFNSKTKIKFSSHAIQRMFERGIQKKIVVDSIMNGEIIQEYPDDKPYPSYLILAFYNNNQPIHIVLALNSIDNEIYIVTVYNPDENLWSKDYKTWRK